MTSIPKNTVFHGNKIYTLAQSRTGLGNPKTIEVFGKGSDLSNIEAMNGRAKCKTITRSLVLSMIDVAIERGDFHNVQPLWNTFHCQSDVITSNGRLYGNYCKNRFCTLCNRIRKAGILNRYMPIIKQWPEPHFVTLTVKSVPGHKLKSFIENGVLRAFYEIKDAQRQRFKRGKGIKLKGIKSIESNFNPIKKTYNPHLHIIVPDRETADLLRNEWIKKWTWDEVKYFMDRRRKDFIDPRAQDINKIKDLEKALIETVKYSGKIFTEPDPNNKKPKRLRKIYANALYIIFDAFKGHRVFDRFGFDLPKVEDYEPELHELTDYKTWQFETCLCNWYSEERNEILTDFSPPMELLQMITDIDIVMK
ncbi:MAG: protein rep [Reichenbachiella sp.]|uniref:protein rep n=1 Tax=Reichenbachiella sp. TaxID=2184521 RepID=UPI003267DABF